MGNLQTGLIYRQVVVKQDVNINGAVVVDDSWLLTGSHTLVLSSHVTLYLLSCSKYLTGAEPGFTTDDGVQESVVGVEPPRLCLDE